MGWSVGYDGRWERWIGYGVPSICDQPGCEAEIDRGLGYVCGSEPYGGEHGCGLFFCSRHGGDDLCDRCLAGEDPHEPTPDTEEWIEHQRTDPTWAAWRKEQDV